MIKLVVAVARKAGLSAEDFQSHWLGRHAPLVAARAPMLGIRRYVQSHLIEHPANEAFRGIRAMLPPLDGITEIWLNALADLKRGVETEQGRAAAATLAEDERRFVQLDRSRCFLTREHPIFDAAG